MTQATDRVDPAQVALTTLSGVGPARAERLARLGLCSVRDLLLFVPRRLEPAELIPDVATARAAVGRRVRVAGRVRNVRVFRRGRQRSTLRVALEDDSGHIDLLFFNQPWLRERFRQGEPLVCEGVVTDGAAIGTPRLVPAGEEPGRPETLYPLTEGIGQDLLHNLCRAAIDRFATALREPLDVQELATLGLPVLSDAVRAVHLAEDAESFEAGRRRLSLEALLALQARLATRMSVRARGLAVRCAIDDSIFEELCGHFPAPFTAGQRRVAQDLAADLQRSVPMRRLLQGDVGAGKTWIAAWAALAVGRFGGQVALMAPTELLAEQHAMGLEPLFARLGLRSVLLTGSLRLPERRAIQQELESGSAQVAIGTHALLSKGVRFRSLALAIVDEQHRFGVAQRERLFDKGRDVHVLLMTATPIPRTLALTLYGDLDVSVLAERPPGRGGVSTRCVPASKVAAMRRFLRERMDAGERVFWVAPRIEGEGGAEAAYEAWVRTVDDVELVHGRLDASERRRRLERFRNGEARLLCGTTVIEVGVDVPEATVMVIGGAHRMGLAQLHQIRGRVGRGKNAAWCFLLGGDAPSERLRALEQSDDGFEIAELDLVQRGMGSLTGLRQAGFGGEGLDAAVFDVELVRFARRVVRSDPHLRKAYAGAAGATPSQAR